MLKLEPIKLDLTGWMDNLKRKETPGRVFYYEHAIGEGIQQKLSRISQVTGDKRTEF